MAIRVMVSVLAVVIGLSMASTGAAHAEPTSPGPTTTSSDDELTDMVDAIEQDGPAPSTTAVPAPLR